MEKEFIPYEQALALKELGFDEPCFFSYDYWNTERLANTYYNYVNYNVREKSVSAPLYQQAFRWFREKHNLIGWVMLIAVCLFNLFYIYYKTGQPNILDYKYKKEFQVNFWYNVLITALIICGAIFFNCCSVVVDVSKIYYY
jgi:hypothetical protein